MRAGIPLGKTVADLEGDEAHELLGAAVALNEHVQAAREEADFMQRFLAGGR